jgi:hypothetical protein
MSPKRPGIKEIFESLFGHLNSEETKTISKLVEETGFFNSTIKTYLELIEFIQSQPKLIIERTGHSYQVKLGKNQ